jgi:hypothetical protein
MRKVLQGCDNLSMQRPYDFAAQRHTSDKRRRISLTMTSWGCARHRLLESLSLTSPQPPCDRDDDPDNASGDKQIGRKVSVAHFGRGCAKSKGRPQAAFSLWCVEGQARRRASRRRYAVNPRLQKPSIIIAQVESSGTAPMPSCSVTSMASNNPSLLDKYRMFDCAS